MLLHMLVWLFSPQLSQERRRQLNWRSVFTEHEMATFWSNSSTQSKVSFPRQECPDIMGRDCNYSISIPHKNAKINTASTYVSLSTHTQHPLWSIKTTCATIMKRCRNSTVGAKRLPHLHVHVVATWDVHRRLALGKKAFSVEAGSTHVA